MVDSRLGRHLRSRICGAMLDKVDKIKPPDIILRMKFILSSSIHLRSLILR